MMLHNFLEVTMSDGKVLIKSSIIEAIITDEEEGCKIKVSYKGDLVHITDSYEDIKKQMAYTKLI